MQKSTLPEMKSITCRWAVTSDTETEHPLYEVSSLRSGNNGRGLWEWQNNCLEVEHEICIFLF